MSDQACRDDPLIGVDFGGTKIEAVALGPAGVEWARVRAPTPRHDYAGSIAAVRDLVARVESGLGGARAIGVGIPGTLAGNGLVKNANSVWLNGRPLARDLEEALGRPVRVENDANCFALSESADGAGAGREVVFGVILGTGCGGGIVAHGRLLRGLNRIGGEWGHNPLPWAGPEESPGPRCWCGRSGCLELWLSGPALAADHVRCGGQAGSSEDVIALMRSGDPVGAATFEAYLDRLSRALAHVVNLLDPSVIVLGGGLSLTPELYPGLTERIGRWVFSPDFVTPVLRNVHGDSSGVRGAARLCLDMAAEPTGSL